MEIVRKTLLFTPKNGFIALPGCFREHSVRRGRTDRYRNGLGCAQIVVAFVAGRKGADGSEAQEDIQAKLPLLAARCVALGIGMGILSLLPGHNIDSNGAI